MYKRQQYRQQKLKNLQIQRKAYERQQAEIAHNNELIDKFKHKMCIRDRDGVYQQKLDEALSKQADAAADDKVDLFLSETDYVLSLIHI